MNNKIDNLITAITTSPEYQSYQNITNKLKQDQEITTLITTIKHLQQQAVKLEYQKKSDTQKIDHEINQYLTKLNNNPLYQEYKRRKDKLNDLLTMSTTQIEQYINSKI